MDCAVIGDSIAVGVATRLHAGCEVHAKVGATSGAILARLARIGVHDVIVISAGSNDPDSRNLGDNLFLIRRTLLYKTKVIWIEPRHRRAARIVRKIAAGYGDAVVTFRAGPDRVHPRSYKALALAVTGRL